MNEVNNQTQKSLLFSISHLGSQLPFPSDSENEEGDFLDQSMLEEILNDLNSAQMGINRRQILVNESRSQYDKMRSEISYIKPDGYQFNELFMRQIAMNPIFSRTAQMEDNCSISQHMSLLNQKQQSTTAIRQKHNLLFQPQLDTLINLSDNENSNRPQPHLTVNSSYQNNKDGDIEDSSSNLNSQFPVFNHRISPDKLSHHVNANYRSGSDTFGFQPKTFLKKGTDLIREISTNDQTGVTSHNSAIINLNPISRRQQSSFIQNQQNTSMQEEIEIEESMDERISLKNEDEDYTPRGEIINNFEGNLQINESLRVNATQFQKQINRQNKILENQAFLVTCHHRKYINQNNQMPTVVLETDSEDVATFKDKQLRLSGKMKLMSQGSNINMLNEQDSMMNMSVNFSKKGTNQLKNSHNGSSGDSGGDRLHEANKAQTMFINGNDGMGNVGAMNGSSPLINHSNTTNRMNTVPRKHQEDSQIIQLDQLEGLLEVEEDEEEKRSYHALAKPQIERERVEDNGIMIELASKHGSQNSRNHHANENDSIFSKTEDVLSSASNIDFDSKEMRLLDNEMDGGDYSNEEYDDDKDKLGAYEKDSISLKRKQTMIAKKTITFIWGPSKNDLKKEQSQPRKNSIRKVEELQKQDDDIKDILESVKKIKEIFPITYYGYSFNKMYRAKMKLNKKERALIIIGQLQEKSKSMAYQRKESDMKVKLKNINGIVLGPQSITYQILIKKHKLSQLTENFWTYMSIVTDERTYDIQFDTRVELVNFYIGMNHCINKIKPNFPKIVSEIQGLSLIQLFKKALYMRAQDLPEITVNDRKYKFQVISKLNGIVQYTPVVNFIELNDLFQLSQALIQDALAQETDMSINLFGTLKNINLQRNDSNYMNDLQSVSANIHPGQLSSTINSDANLLMTMNLGQFGFMQNQRQQDHEEQWKVTRIKAILATSIRSIQRTNISKANERKSILASNQLARRFRNQVKNNQAQLNRSQNQGVHTTRNNPNLNTSQMGWQTKVSEKMYNQDQSETSIVFSPNRRTQNLNDLPEFQFENQNSSNLNNSQNKNQNNFSTTQDNMKFPRQTNENLKSTFGKRDNKIDQQEELDKKIIDGNILNNNPNSEEQSRSRSKKSKKGIVGFFKSFKKQAIMKQTNQNQVALLVNELTKVFNLSKKYYMFQQRRFSKEIRFKMEKMLDKHLKKKITFVEKMTDYKSKIEYLTDIKDFYIRHCDQESEHFNIITQKLIDANLSNIPQDVLEERARRRIDYNQLRMKMEQIKFSQLQLDQQQTHQLQQTENNSGFVSDLNQTNKNQSFMMKGNSYVTGPLNGTFKMNLNQTYGNINGSMSAEPSTPQNKFKQIVELKRLKSRKMECF
eukprot:403353291